jgi:hypothetical protein
MMGQPRHAPSFKERAGTSRYLVSGSPGSGLVGRENRGKLSMKKTVVALAVLAAIATFSTAGYSGKASKPSSGGSSIALDSVLSGDGTAKLAGTKPALGNRVTFASTVGSLAGWEYPMVVVSCYQSGKMVWATIDDPSASFLLGGTNSDWAVNGGAAACTGELAAYGWHRGIESIRSLATTSFDATA